MFGRASLLNKKTPKAHASKALFRIFLYNNVQITDFSS